MEEKYMLKKDLLEKIKNAKDEDDVNALLVGTDVETQFKGEEPSLDGFKTKLKTDKAFQQFMDSERDTYHSKAMKTLKEKGTWESEFSDVMKEKYPDLVKDPKDKQMFEMQKELERMKSESARKDMLGDAVKYAAGKKLPTDFVERFLGDDLDATKVNLDGLAEIWSKGLEASMDEKLKSSSYVPGGTGADGTKTSIGAAMAQQNNGAKNAPSDPWASK
jgi:hypothetical protein